MEPKDRQLFSNSEAELNVLRWFMEAPENFGTLQRLMQVPHGLFHDKRYRLIYIAMESLHSQNKALSLLVLEHVLSGPRYKEHIPKGYASGVLTPPLDSLFSIDEALRLLIEHYNARNTLGLLQSESQSLASGQRPEVEVIYQKFQDQSEDLLRYSSAKGIQKADVASAEAIEKIQVKAETPHMKGIPTGMPKLDEAIGGFQRGRLYILAASTSVGKSALALNFALSAMAHERICLFFSLEMQPSELCERVLSIKSGINSMQLSTGNVTPEQIASLKQIREGLTQELSHLHIKYDLRMTIERLAQDAKSWAVQQNISFIIVDYLQLLKTSQPDRQHSREREVAYISSELKRLSATLDVPVLALAQLNRSVTNRKDTEPRVGDIRESSGIEHDADCVMFLQRHHGDIDPGTGHSQSPYLKVAKNRQGPCLKIDLEYNSNTTLFQEQRFRPDPQRQVQGRADSVSHASEFKRTYFDDIDW